MTAYQPPQPVGATPPRYFIERTFYGSNEWTDFQNQIDADGFCLPFGTSYRVYSATLAAFLNTAEVSVTVNTRKVKVTWGLAEREGVVFKTPTVIKSGERKTSNISGYDYIGHYRTAYDEGREWFVKAYGPAPAIVYGPHAKSYVADLHTLMYHTPCGAFDNGLIGWKGYYPLMINADIIARIGYHSGIIAEIEQLASRHESLFSDLLECEHTQQISVDFTTDPAPISTAPATDQPPTATAKGKPLPAAPFFVPEVRQRLYDALTSFVDEPERPALAELIVSGKAIDRPILHRIQQNVLAYVFTQLMVARPPQITASQTDVARWICANFSPATYDTVYDVIRGKKVPAKDKRINISL